MKQKPKKSAKKRGGIFSFWKDMDPERKDRFWFVTGLVVAALTALTLIASVSYLFSWIADGSLLNAPDALQKGVPVQNAGGKLGFPLAHFLVGRCFGLASFILIGYLCVISFFLVTWKNLTPSGRRFLAVLSGVYLLSLVLAYVSSLAGWDGMFYGNGLGGGLGFLSVDGLRNLIGVIPTGILLAVLICIWLLLVSRRFSSWILSLGKDEGDPEIDMDGPEEAAQEWDERDDPEQDIEDIVIDESALDAGEVHRTVFVTDDQIAFRQVQCFLIQEKQLFILVCIAYNDLPSVHVCTVIGM